MAKKRNNNPKNNKPLVTPQLVVKAPQRKVYDVGIWRAALRSADTGRVKTLYDLFEDVLIDGVLSDAIGKRIEAVTISELIFQNSAGEEVPEIKELIDTLAWEELLTQIMNVKFWGRSGCEFDFSNDFSVEPIPKKHINLDNKTILLNESDEKGVPYEGDSNLLILGQKRDFGLLLKAAPYIIYKRGGFGDWSQWIELFGMPQRVGKYNTYDPESRKLLEDAFEKAGSAPYVVIPKESEVETRESSSSNGGSYNEFRQACNEETLITILGQTMTTVQGEKGARSLGEVHKEVEESKHKSDLQHVQRILNTYVLPLLEARGYPVGGGKFVFPKAAEPLTVSDLVSLSSVIKIPTRYLYDKYGIPVPKDGEEIAQRQAQPAPVDIEGNDDPEDEPGDNSKAGKTTPPDKKSKSPKADPVKNNDRNFLLRLYDFFVKAPQAGAHWSNGKAPIILKDEATFEDKLFVRIANGEADYFDAGLFRFIANNLINAVQTPFKRHLNNADVQYVYGAQDDAFITAMEMNLFHFSAGKTLAEIQELNRIFRESTSFADFTEKAEKVTTTFNKTWQKTEYETAILTAESASNFHRLRKKTNLFPYWKYVIVDDDKTREEHRKLNGIILPANDPRWKKIFPPNGWKCRCWIVPMMKHEVEGIDFTAMRARVDEYFTTAEWKQNEAQGWDINRGETAEVFTKNQQYINKFPDKASALLGEIYYNSYGLDSFGKKLSKATAEIPAFEGDAKKWYQENNTLTDYKGRIVALPEDVFTRHTSQKYERARVPLLECIPEVLKKPDEIWLNDYQKEFNNFNFIKFYKGKVINIVCEVKDGKVYRVCTWFEIEQKPRLTTKTPANRKKDTRWKYRRGLLIYTKRED